MSTGFVGNEVGFDGAIVTGASTGAWVGAGLAWAGVAFGRAGTVGGFGAGAAASVGTSVGASVGPAVAAGSSKATSKYHWLRSVHQSSERFNIVGAAVGWGGGPAPAVSSMRRRRLRYLGGASLGLAPLCFGGPATLTLDSTVVAEAEAAR